MRRTLQSLSFFRLRPRVRKHVGTEMALHVVAYNMKRVMKILGLGGLMEAGRRPSRLSDADYRDDDFRNLCRFSTASNDEALHALWRPAAEKRQGVIRRG